VKDYKYLKTRQVNNTLWVEINNPPVNFLLADICEELYHLIREIEKDPGIRVFILTGGIEDTYIFHFSIPELVNITKDNKKLMLDKVFQTRLGAALMQYNQTFTMWMMDKFPWYERLILSLTKKMRGFSSTLFLLFQMHRCYYAIEEMGKITIAAINGSCSGGGTEMGTCFDFRFMIDDQGFSISQPEALVGIVPGGGGNTRLPRLIGKAKALEFMLTADLWSPEEAKRNNLITDHFPKKDFHAKVQEFADRMSRRIPVAVREIKNTVHKGLDASLMHCLSIEMGGTVRCFADKYTQNALKEYVKVIKERIEEPKGKRGTIAENLILMQSDEIINRIFKE
jgi:enoyl-CoA hydratase/carnithine racemase